MHRTNNLAIASLVCGIAAWSAAPILASIAAIVTGHMARAQIRASAGSQDGDGLALAGLVLGYLNLFVALIGLALLVLTFLGVLGLGLFGT